MLKLEGRTALVAGAGSVGPGWSNGRATSVLLARQGASILALDRDAKSLEETARLVEAEGGRCVTHLCDMTQAADVEKAVEVCRSTFGTIDILVNNVGGSAPGDPVSMTEEVWDAQMAHNLKTAFLGCKFVLPVMVGQGRGAIVNLSSVAALRMGTERVHVAYSASKAGILALTKSVALAHAKHGIRCNAVVPGLMHTPLVEQRLAGTVGGGDLAALIDRRNALVPMGRMGDAWDVAHCILFLVSDEARYITATEIVVDGGLTSAGM